MAKNNRNKSHLINYEPAGRAECLCGSGKRFKNCCKKSYSLKKFNGTSLYNKGEYSKALKSTRAQITWYKLCHEAHTVTSINAGHKESSWLLNLDIEALYGLLTLLLACYEKCNLLDDYEHVISKQRNAIADEKWKIKIDCLSIELLYVYQSNKDSSIAILKKYDLSNTTDINLLKFWLCLDEYINQVDKIILLKRVSESTKSEAEKLQYSSQIGIEYCLLNDFKKGIPLIKQAAIDYDKIPDGKKSLYGRYLFANVLKVLADLTNNTDVRNNAIELLLNEVSSGEYSTLGMAKLWFDIGECYFFNKDNDSALKAYDKSLSLDNSSFTVVMKVRVLIKLSKTNQARTSLIGVETSGFSDPNFFDLAISWCYLGLKTKNKDDVDKAVSMIKDIQTVDPFFKDIKHDLSIKLYEVEFNTDSILQKLNRYVELKPNIMGLGINFNAIIDDILN